MSSEKNNEINVLGSRIKALREQHNLTQLDLAKQLNIGNSTLCQYEGGQRIPSDDIKIKIATFFNVTVDYLLGTEKKPESTIVTLDNVNIHMIPLFESVSAGFGVTPSDEVVDFVPCYISSEYDAENTICIRVCGDSMYPKIENGDIIQVHKQTSVDSGSIAVVFLDGEGLVKKVEHGEGYIILHSINPLYPPMKFEGKDILRIEVVGLVKKIIKDV